MKNSILTIILLAQTIITTEAIGQEAAELVYDKVAADLVGAQAKTNTFALDLRGPQVSQVMLRHLNERSEQKASRMAAHAVLARVLCKNPVETFEWVLDNYGALTPFGRAMIANSFAEFNCQESYTFLVGQLSDHNAVVNKRAAALAPISPTTPYEHLRVCDYAYNSLVWMLHKNEALPSELLRRLSWNTSLEARDIAITRLLDWWSKNSAKVLEQKMSIGTARPSVQEKIRLLLNRQAIGEGSESLEKRKQGE